MNTQITVKPAGEAWMLALDGVAEPALFASGARAERAARELAGRLSEAGMSSVITLRLRDGTIASRFVCPATDLVRADDRQPAPP